MSDMTVMARLTADSKSWVSGFKQAENAAKNTATVAQQASTKAQAAQAKQAQSMNAIRTGALVVGVAMVAFAAKSVSAFNDAGMQATKLQRTMGGSIESVSAYAGAANLLGINTETMNRSMGIFDKNLVKAAQSGATTKAMADTLGTSFTDASGNVKNLDQILPGLMDKFKSMPDGPEKTALALQLFGRGGREMVKFLNQGSAGMDALKAKAKELGVVLDSDGIAKFKAYREATNENKVAMQGLEMQFGSAILPAVTSLTTGLTKAIGVFGNLPGPVKTATVAVVGFGVASMLIGPRVSGAISALSALGSGAAGAVRGLASAGSVLGSLTNGGSAATGAMNGLAAATGAAGTGAKNAGTGLSGASGGTMMFAAAAGAAGMAISTLIGKFNAANGTLGAMTSVIMAMTGPFSALGLAAGAASGQTDKFRETDVTMQALAQTLQKMNPDEQAAAWARMTQGMTSEDIATASSRLAELGVNVNGVAAAADEADQQMQDLADEVDRFQGMTAQQSAVQFKQDIMSFTQSLKDSKGAFGDSKDGLANQAAAMQITSGVAKGYKSEMDGLTKAGLESGPQAAEVAARYVAQGNAIAAAIPKGAAGTQMINNLNAAMAGVPGWKPINVNVMGAAQAKAEMDGLAAKANMTPKQLTVAINALGAAPTAAQIAGLARQLGTTPKKLTILLQAMGIQQVAADGTKAGIQAGLNTKSGIQSQMGAVNAAGRGLGGAMAQGAAAGKGEAFNAGQQVGAALGQGVVSGIQSNLGGAISAAASAGAQVAAAYKAAAKTSSPSQYGIDVGVGLNDGVMVGLRSNGGNALNAARQAGAAVGSAYGSAWAASDAAIKKAQRERNWTGYQDKLNKQGLTKAQLKAGASSGKGDLWRAGADAAQEYADGIASAAADAVKAAQQMRVQVADALQTSGKGDWTSQKSASGLKAWGASQLKSILNFEKNLGILAARGLPQSMLQMLIGKGLDAAPLAASLASTSAGNFAAIAAQGAAIDVAAKNLADTGSGLYFDRAAAAGTEARQGAGTNSFDIYIGGEKINEIVGVTVNGKVGEIVNKMVYS